MFWGKTKRRLFELEHIVDYIKTLVIADQQEELSVLRRKVKYMSKQVESNNQQIHLLKKQMTEVGHRLSRSGF